MKRAMVIMMVAGVCLAGEAPNHIPHNPIPQQQFLGIMMVHAALVEDAQIIADKPDRLSHKKYNQNKCIVPKTQKLPKQKNRTLNQPRPGY